MVKRRATIESDDESQSPQASPASKRARTTEADDDALEVEGTKPSKKRVANGKGKARRRKQDDEDDEDDEENNAGAEGETDADEQQFEEEHEEVIRAVIEAKRRVHGGIAEHGIIETIEMHQFMCHKYLTFTFGPQINFIIGHNGSGKSAVLSAITVALGGKATSTGRGSGLKSFIREGQSIAEVTISLKNQGEEAYKPKEYGKSIIITRRFTKEGASSWKIKNKDGKVISTKKDELAAICDHMNIQVDNPMNVLTQDAARQFLSASHPSDKYKFFLRGTQLSQLSDEYDTCLENITQTTKVLAQKKEAIPDLRNAFKEATARFEEASKAREQKKKADELKKELAWAHVANKEGEMTKKIEEAAKMTRRLEKIQEGLDKSEVDFHNATQQVELFEGEHRDLGDIDHLNARKRQLNDDMRGNREKLAELTANEKQMNSSLKGTRMQIADFEQRIAEEAKRMEEHTQAKRDEIHRKLEKARQEVTSADQALKLVLEQKRTKLEESQAILGESKAAEAQKAAAQTRIAECTELIRQCREQAKDALRPYGNDIKGVLDTIGRSRWYGEKPLGPLGVYVKVKDPQSWAELLRSQLSSYLTAFAITDARDRSQLKHILEQTRNKEVLIIIYQQDMFDYRSGEPPEHMLTMLRALEISDPYVLRILINQARIERNFLARTRYDGENILGGVSVGTAFTADGFRVSKFSDGGGGSNTLQFLRSNDPKNLLLSGRDSAGDVRHYEAEMATAEVGYKEANREIARLRSLHVECQRALEALTRSEKLALGRHRDAKYLVNTLQEEANTEMPAGIAGLEAAKKEAEDEKESILEQFAELSRQREAIDAAQRPMMQESDDIRRQIGSFEEKRVAARKKIEDAVSARMIAQNSKSHYENKLNEEKDKAKKVEEAAQILQEEFANWTARAEEYCERVPNPRKVDTVQRNLDSVQAALKEREKRHGATVEEMTIEVNKAKANLEAVDRDLRNMASLNKALKQSLIVRLAKWQEFRRHIALRCKLVFQYHLSNRGYYGKVLFDHNAGTLQLKVQTDDQAAVQGSRDKDPRSLSGGEKSFSTICLLLSLWESIGCPLRCLDEFDVFMDAVNRRISMRMMIDTANASDKKQYILITPQDMNNVQIGTTVRVHRMTDPERGQGVLAF